ncbi:MAG: hypothetical protein CSB06_02720 [Bacteroidia bacterium]|nr:MAG: hypothetical protein CSB06_02720 [Bacteroidia bacterium]
MKKTGYFLFALLLSVTACKFEENPYSYSRECNDGTYRTEDGILKYISGRKDKELALSDNYATVKQEITYIGQTSENILPDSVLLYGHTFAKTEEDLYFREKPITFDMFKSHAVVVSNNGLQQAPTQFITSNVLAVGESFKNTLPLNINTHYYIKSFVVTGYFDKDNNKPVYKHIAYNPLTLELTTKNSKDRWVSATTPLDQVDEGDRPENFIDGEYRGGISFVYKDQLYMAQGHSETPMGNSIIIRRYNPETNKWDETPFSSNELDNLENFHSGVAFVIEKAEIGNNNKRDCLYIGMGVRSDGSYSKDFYRLDLEKNEWVQIAGPGAHMQGNRPPQDFPLNAGYKGVAFSINGVGYVGLGKTGPDNSSIIKDFVSYSPSSEEYAYGEWRKAESFRGGQRMGASVFKIGNNVYIVGGMNQNGDFPTDVWMCQRTGNDRDPQITWTRRADLKYTYKDLAGVEHEESVPGRQNAVGFNIGEMGYFGTGNDADTVYRDMYRYNPALNKWERRANYAAEYVENDDQAPFFERKKFTTGKHVCEAVGGGIQIGKDIFKAYVGTGWDNKGNYNHGDNNFWLYLP